MCEDCGEVRPSYGLLGEQTKRWCSGCGKRHVGAVSVQQRQKCEDNGEKQPSFTLPGERTLRWCSGCGKGHRAVDERRR